jgi:hypothetical protein
LCSHSSLLDVLPSAGTHSERDAGSCCVNAGTIAEDRQYYYGFKWFFWFLSSAFSSGVCEWVGRNFVSVWLLALGSFILFFGFRS